MYVPNLKSVALTIPEIIGVPKEFGQSLDTPTLPFLENFCEFLFGCTLSMYLPKKVEFRGFIC